MRISCPSCYPVRKARLEIRMLNEHGSSSKKTMGSKNEAGLSFSTVSPVINFHNTTGGIPCRDSNNAQCPNLYRIME